MSVCRFGSAHKHKQLSDECSSFKLATCCRFAFCRAQRDSRSSQIVCERKKEKEREKKQLAPVAQLPAQAKKAQLKADFWAGTFAAAVVVVRASGFNLRAAVVVVAQ